MTRDETWFAEIESKYRNYFKTRVEKSLPEYDIDFPTQDINATPSHFPTVLFKEIKQVEKGNDLDNTSVNAVLEYIEIQVITNGDLAEIKDITAVTTVQMKALRFNAIRMPVYLKEDENVRRSISKFSRLIGADDSI